MSDPAVLHGSQPPRATIDVAAAVLIRDGKLLITQRPRGSHLGGLWEFPGGKAHAGETLEACLSRELREELGIEVEVGSLLELVTHAYPEKTVRLHFFRCRWKRHEPRTLGCPAFKWITANALGDHEFPEADARLVQSLQNDPEMWR